MTTRGDQILETPLYQAGGKGLFIKELEVALLEGRADLAVHSLKDVPMELEAPFALVAIGEREDPRDAFVSNRYDRIDDLPKGARVGTASLRRACQLRARRPDLVVETLRGNVGYNAARALVNINDGAFGGHLLERNLLFNAVRETHDHGPVNSCASATGPRARKPPR